MGGREDRGVEGEKAKELLVVGLSVSHVSLAMTH